MARDKNQEWTIELKLPGASSADLRGRQSVRATFKLTAGCIDAISIVSRHLGIKQKSLFDHLAEDIQSLRSIAKEVQDTKLKQDNRVQKTFVISRRSLYSLDEISKHFNAPRDALVEYSVQRLIPIIAKERKKHTKRKEMLGEIIKHLQKGNALLKQLEDSLGRDDPLFYKLHSVIGNYKTAYQQMDAFVERGNIIEDFHPEIMGRIF